MSNYFLKVDKDFFKLGLNPTEILILSQIAEFNNNTGDCFISNETLAENFGVSVKTISRSMKTLEDRKFITRETKNVKGGKERHVKINVSAVSAALTRDNLSIVEDTENSQGTKCPLSKDNLSIVKGQNDSIKDNTKDNIKDNLSNEVLPVEEEESPKAELGSMENPIVVEKEWLVERYNFLTPITNNRYKYNNKYYKLEVAI